MAMPFHHRPGPYLQVSCLSHSLRACLNCCDLSPTEDTSPSRPRARQAGAGQVAPARAATLLALSGRVRDQNIALPAADHTRHRVASRDGPLSRSDTPRTRLRRSISLRLAHPSPFLKKQVVAVGLIRISSSSGSDRLRFRRQECAGSGASPGNRFSIESRDAADACINLLLRSGRVWKTTDGTRRRATRANPDVESIFSKEQPLIYDRSIAYKRTLMLEQRAC
jgi:hypothetical protein